MLEHGDQDKDGKHGFNQRANWFIRADYQYVGERLNTFSPEDPEEAFRVFEAYGLLNSRVGVQFPNYEFSFFITNHTNKAANFGEIFCTNGKIVAEDHLIRYFWLEMGNHELSEPQLHLQFKF